jgi:phosphoribosyl-ATP pyrophosphohydrolase
MQGLQKLETLLKDRKKAAPEGSYTKRLFEDPDLLKKKLLEEVK